MEMCKRCGDFIFDKYHSKPECSCKPFLIVDEDGEEHKVFGVNEDDVAMKYAEKSNVNGDYYLVNNSVNITVNGNEYEISAEPDINYFAVAK